jgi:hypothetical protein
MGLGATTRVWVEPSELKTMDSLAYLISKSLGIAKNWWDNEASPNYKNL